MRTTSPRRTAAARATRIAAERRASPEAGPWLSLLERALEEAERAPWTALEPGLAGQRRPEAPLLHEAIVAVERRAARRWVRGLLKAAAAAGGDGAASLNSLRGRLVDPLALLAAAVAEDEEALTAMAARGGADPAAFAAVARIAALPLLRGCAAALGGAAPAGWARGHCPACGGPPAVAELRGLERTRVLRCARCATGWELPVLVCPFCDERDHQRQLSFAVEGQEQRRRVDACRSCGGYVKTLTTLSPSEPWAVPLDDVATLELDLVAEARGLRRPARSAFPAALRLVDARGPFGRALEARA